MSETPQVRYYVVTRALGPRWDRSRGMREQECWDEHAAFMDGLAGEGFIVLGGPLGDGSSFLHVVDAATEQEIAARFATDPWTPMELLRILSIEPWEILLRAPGVNAVSDDGAEAPSGLPWPAADAAPAPHREPRPHPRG